MSENIKNFYDLNAWNKAHEFALEIYKATKSFPREELYGITSQLRKAATSIGANIAEGFSRYHYNDKIRFYHNARGSVSEIQSFLFLSKDIPLLNKDKFKHLFELSEGIIKLINGLIRSIEKQK